MTSYLRWIAFVAVFSVYAAEPVKLQRLKVPSPPWPAGDERGMANQIGPYQPKAKPTAGVPGTARLQ